MLEVYRLSPAPAMLLSGNAVGGWELNPAALNWGLTAVWSVADWQRLAERVREVARAGTADGEAAAVFGVRWRAIEAEGALLAWLMPEVSESNAATPLPLPMGPAIELMGLSIWRVDLAQGRIYANARGFVQSGVTRPPPVEEGMLLSDVRQYVHPDDVAQLERATQAAIVPGTGVVDAPARYRQPDGSYRTLLTRRFAEFDEAGRPLSLVGVAFDITEQREALDRLRDVERRAAIAAEFAGFGIWQVDLVTGEQYWDAQMFRLRGVDPTTNPDIEAVREASSVPESLARARSMIEDIARRVREGSLPEDFVPPTTEFQVVWPDDTVHWLCMRGTVLREEGQNPQLLGLHWDITDIRQARELREQRMAAEEANRAKSRFLANMSHEIRTPMNAILGMAHLALRTELDPRQHNYLLKIERSAKALLGLINDILDFSKIEADKLDLERIEFSLGDVLDDLSNLVGLQAEEKGLELVFALPPSLPARLIGDPLRLGQVLVNLVNNAVKFTERGEVVLTIEAVTAPGAGAETSADAPTLRFTVSDSGSGMTAQQLERLFQPFEQADPSTSRQHGGTGLGLAISHRLVHSMGGRLEVHSAPGQGSSFAFDAVFELPAAAADALVSSPPSPPLAGERVLVVDDNARARELLVGLCNGLGLQVEGAADAWDAQRAVALAADAGQPFELVLVDADMPGMDGVACAAQLLSGRHQGRAIALASTVFGRDGVVQRLAAVGLPALPVLVKPVTPSGLLDTVVRALGRPRGAEAREPPRSVPVDRARHRLQGLRVLLVDDNEINQELACEILGEAGVAVTVAEHGAHALELIQQQDFDVVLMDCQMPVMDGYEATVEIRRESRWASLPIIAMTANVMSGDRERALACGMNDHIAKPIDIDAMFATLARWAAPPAS